MEETSTDVNVQGTETQPADVSATDTQTAETSGFAVPDQYKESGWAKNIDSYEKLWSAHANAQELIGRKTIGIPTENSSEAEIEEFYGKVRPETVDGYDFDLGDDTAIFKDIFHKNGISTRQAKSITDAYKESVRKVEEQLYSQEGFDSVMKENLGESYKDKIEKVNGFLKQFGSKDALAEVDKLPNQTIGLMYKLIDLTMDKYGVKELGSVQNKSATTSVQDLGEYMNEMKALDRNPFATHQMKLELKRKYGIIK